MKKRRLQVTCVCAKYNFPHRIGGGKCSGSLWAESYLQIDTSLCRICVCFNSSEKSCDVADGKESIDYCEGYHDHLLYQPTIRLPISTEKWCLEKLEEFEQRFRS